MEANRRKRHVAALVVSMLAVMGCGSGSGGSSAPTVLGTPLSGVDDGVAVTFNHGMARSLVGLTDVWDHGVHPDSAPFGIFISSATLSCATALDGNPPQGYTLLIAFPSDDVGAEAEENKLFRHKGGWVDTSGTDATAPTTITAADGDSFSAGLDLTWEWYDGKVGSLSGDFTVTSCLEQ
jgi:hypothetical protein